MARRGSGDIALRIQRIDERPLRQEFLMQHLGVEVLIRPARQCISSYLRAYHEDAPACETPENELPTDRTHHDAGAGVGAGAQQPGRIDPNVSFDG